MTKYIYKSDADRKLIENSFSYIANMIFGSKNNKDKTSIMREMFAEYVKKVEIIPWGINKEYINSNTPGVCRFDDEDKIIIEMWGYTNAPVDKRKWIEHEGVHEFCHAFVDLLSSATSKKITKKGVVRENSAGLIEETDPKTGKLVGNHYYGKMFNETMMDIISAMAINNYAPTITYTTVDDVLRNNYTTTGNQQTGYTFFTSITRLMIAAFSNVGDSNFNYQSYVDAGYGIFTLTNKLGDGSVVRGNDFLYGIVFDPMHIEKEFDKYMGDDAWRTVCHAIDSWFINYQRTGELPAKNVKLIMDLIPDFCNKRMADYERRGLVTLDERINMVGNFNRIWNSMQSEYGAYFSKSDIDEIYNRARKY